MIRGKLFPRQVCTPCNCLLISVAFVVLCRVGCLWVTSVFYRTTFTTCYIISTSGADLFGKIRIDQNFFSMQNIIDKLHGVSAAGLLPAIGSKRNGMDTVFHMLCSRHSRPLTPTAPTATRL